MRNIIILLRPHQWLKNVFVFLPLFFHGDLGNVPMLVKALVAFFAYSLAASGIYCLNDLIDVEADRRHPKKRKRPIALGAVSKGCACMLVALCWMASAAVIMLLGADACWKALAIIVFYIVMNIAYCLKLKRMAIVDVFVIAVGFVLRMFIGGVVTGVSMSQWIVLMTFLLALFLAFAKRRDDVVIYEDAGVKARENVNRYNLPFMNQVIGIVCSITMVCYIMYTVSPETTVRMGSSHVYLTSVFVLAGIIRYLQLTIVDTKSGSPTKVLMKDRFVQCSIILWILSFVVLIYL